MQVLPSGIRRRRSKGNKSSYSPESVRDAKYKELYDVASSSKAQLHLKSPAPASEESGAERRVLSTPSRGGANHPQSQHQYRYSQPDQSQFKGSYSRKGTRRAPVNSKSAGSGPNAQNNQWAEQDVARYYDEDFDFQANLDRFDKEKVFAQIKVCSQQCNDD